MIIIIHENFEEVFTARKGMGNGEKCNPRFNFLGHVPGAKF